MIWVVALSLNSSSQVLIVETSSLSFVWTKSTIQVILYFSRDTVPLVQDFCLYFQAYVKTVYYKSNIVAIKRINVKISSLPR